jgi:alkanesulfonate monooxygenase
MSNPDNGSQNKRTGMCPSQRRIEIFSTCPPIGNNPGVEYSKAVADAARWSEKWGCTGMLVYTDNSQVDPWLVSQLIVQGTQHLAPLVAVQPVYMHPYTVAKMVSSLGVLYGRRIYLNLVAGGFKNDLAALNDPTPHDERYDRLVEYATVIKGLLADHEPISFQGKFYRVDKLKMTPPLPKALFPGVLISGSSEAGLFAARFLEAVPILYAKPAKDCAPTAVNTGGHFGIRIGIMARPTEEEAWKEAHGRFPEEKKGKMVHELAMKVSDSVWHHELSRAIEENKTTPGCYWLVPFENYKTFCPYLVGSYEQVAQELARYLALGCGTFILDIPLCEEDLQHARIAFDLACNKSHFSEDDRSTLAAAPAPQEEGRLFRTAGAGNGNAEKPVPILRMSGV